ncbi:hypothetical protein HBH56_007950 [Parastagonospora nodorum]|uniref:Uncharacterized protein n=1 Tax=Phaeosphaeria nodorum (strain SN15 / ATCC MYA-4574 / FGSC 10173) TaxID=321614 RepID=A0A7U2HWD6_PHANO|nr:hypothetical protein HBH56_007950 [Parastagonospora nodorum]QRC90567.1 hypothetical protein JI435_425700 [Parastagonospora nodorum SN15]KAH3922214.1 hypothetical protein HBH54_227860 [Parastagonospora nodorum]KAH3960060.1 hypothetical protein HBH52_239730 [Parastagonospora nodorum]KAH4072978.1 hypothetical protein HBH50_047790 [Parastagonospora nodorum]
MMLSRAMRTHKASHFHGMTGGTSLFASKPRQRLGCYLASLKYLPLLVDTVSLRQTRAAGTSRFSTDSTTSYVLHSWTFADTPRTDFSIHNVISLHARNAHSTLRVRRNIHAFRLAPIRQLRHFSLAAQPYRL